MDAEWHQTNWSVNKAMDFINSRTEFDDPWLYSVNIFDPHHSFDPPRDYLPPPNYFDGELDNNPNSSESTTGEPTPAARRTCIRRCRMTITG